MTQCNRFELKYVVPLSTCATIEADLEHRLIPDANGDAGSYSLTSLYYDSPQLDCFWSKIEGLRFRRKLRLRVYDDCSAQGATAMVEIKERDNRTVRKRRVALPLADAIALCAGQALRDVTWGEQDASARTVIDEVLYMVKALALQPTAITRYHRRALQGVGPDAGLRVTFDTDFEARMHALDVSASASNHLVLARDHAIMEVKVNETVPDWMVSLLARHQCSLQRISKYCAGVALLKHRSALPMAVGPNVPIAGGKS